MKKLLFVLLAFAALAAADVTGPAGRCRTDSVRHRPVGSTIASTKET